MNLNSTNNIVLDINFKQIPVSCRWWIIGNMCCYSLEFSTSFSKWFDFNEQNRNCAMNFWNLGICAFSSTCFVVPYLCDNNISIKDMVKLFWVHWNLLAINYICLLRQWAMCLRNHTFSCPGFPSISTGSREHRSPIMHWLLNTPTSFINIPIPKAS